PVILDSPTPSYEDCENIPADDCLDDLQTFLHVTALPFTYKEEDLDVMCEKALHGYNCTVVLSAGGCLDIKQKEMLPIFISSASYMFLMLCGNGYNKDGYLKEAFLSSSECILENKKQMECCAQETGVSEIPVLHITEDTGKSLVDRQINTCCPLSRYLQCTFNVIDDKCGTSAANLTRTYIRTAAGPEVEEICDKLHNYPDPDSSTCSSPVPICSGCLRIHFQYYAFIFTLIAYLWFYFN
ncbi:uncharacterized protein NPIL_191381, partial [Nephila pilipes]